MGQFIIEGGYPLRGTVALAGAKNSGFKLVIASLLADSPSEIIGYSQIGDIEITQKIIESLGGKIERTNHHLKVFSKSLSSFTVPSHLGKISRACSFFVPPLLFRFGQAVFPIPGGDKIGPRPINLHLAGLEALGATVKIKNNLYQVEAPQGLKGNKFRFKINTHTGTETFLMAAAFAKGRTILENAAEEPEVDEMIAFLNKMGAKIKRTAKRKIEIQGVSRFEGVQYEVMPDRNEAVTFGVAALATMGDVFVKKAKPEYLQAFLEKAKECGGGYQVTPKGIRFWRNNELQATKVKAIPYPGFMTDWQPLWTVLMTQAKGESEIIETIHNFRFNYVKQLVSMGAKIKPFNPKVKNPVKFYNFPLEDEHKDYYHGIKIKGPTPLRGARMTVSDIRAGATLTLAALIARGKSTLTRIEHIDRGYENLDERLRQLGARIKRVE
jgi:UDP-N-acetylglucosamine 1-carboxyvinyltransferase